jgi:hypothetical protein
MSTNTDEQFDGLAVAVGVQSAFGTPHASVPGLTTPLDLADGMVLGDAESGDANAGVNIPNIVAVSRAVSPVAASFTQSADKFQKAEVNGFSVSFVMQGNGATASNPISTTPGEAALATLIPGLDAMFQSMGLESANGTTPVVEYTPLATGNIYTTWKIFHGDLAMVYSDCIIESASLAFTPGGFCIVTANIVVGTFDTSTGVDGFTFPTVDYEEMASLTGPIVEGVNFTWGEVNGFENLTIEIAAGIEKFGDSNVDVSGERQAQTDRIIKVSGTLYVETTDSDVHFQNLIDGTAPTVDLSFQIGDVTIADGTYNSFKIECNKIQVKDIKYNQIGTALVVELNDSKCTATVAGGEFKLTLN